MTTAVWLSIPAMALFFGLWTGVPLWLVRRHPDEKTGPTRTLPAYLARQSPQQVISRLEIPQYEAPQRRAA
jgi:hypothetical protein